jgi:hypothetical protein
MAAFKIKIIDSSSNNPSSRGKAERAVQQVKTIMRKMLVNAKSGTLNWENLPLLVSKVMNHSITPRTGFKPIEMVMGRGGLAQSFLDLPALTPPHHLVKHKGEEIDIKTKEIGKMAVIAAQNLAEIREKVHENENKKRMDKALKLKKGDIVFALDRYNLPGNSRPLKSTFLPSPYVVLEPKYTTCLVERLADKFTALISNDDIKPYKHVIAFSENVPKQIIEIFRAKFDDLMPDDIKKITKFDPLKVPPGINLEENEDEMNEDNLIRDILAQENEINPLDWEDFEYMENNPPKINPHKSSKSEKSPLLADSRPDTKTTNIDKLQTILEEDEMSNNDAKILRSGKRVKFH